MLCPALKPELMWNCQQISGKFQQWTGIQSSPDAWSLYATVDSVIQGHLHFPDKQAETSTV